MGQPRKLSIIKECRYCKSTEDLCYRRNGEALRMCKTCRNNRSIEAYSKREYRDQCSLCNTPKKYNRELYCNTCKYNKNHKYYFKQMEPDFLIDVHKLVRRIDVNKGQLTTEDLIRIVMMWCDSTLWPNRYNSESLSVGDQILLMFEDLKRLLRGEGVIVDPKDRVRKMTNEKVKKVKEPKIPEVKYKTCLVCNKEFIKVKRTATCSDECHHLRDLELWRSAQRRRKMKKEGL